jgi:hypothetical protein
MSEQTIPPDGKAPIGYHPLDDADPPVPVTGATDVLCEIRRASDNFVFDWDDDTFKTSGWTTAAIALTEVGSTGYYRLDETNHDEGFDTSAITNPVSGEEDVYIVRIYEGTGNDIANLPAVGEIITKTIAAADIKDDAIDAASIATDAIGADALAASALAEIKAEVDQALADVNLDTTFTARLTLAYRLLHNRFVINESTDQAFLYDDAGTSVILTIPLKDKDGNTLILPAGIPYDRGVPT